MYVSCQANSMKKSQARRERKDRLTAFTLMTSQTIVRLKTNAAIF